MSIIHRTRIKFCGLSRPEEIECVSALGADAIGLVFYKKSVRSLTIADAAQLARLTPPFISVVGLFVNATLDEIKSVAQNVPLTLLQFHGDETPEQCVAFGRAVNLPWLRAIPVGVSTRPSDLIKLKFHYSQARGLLLDTLVSGYGGSGKVFDWNIVPMEIAHQAILSGGLNIQNVGNAIKKLHPFAVDVSSGVEIPGVKGTKDCNLIKAFVHAVRTADA
ncbi:MAG: phosphoribosylanthranilate isomerase [Burkholderia sp.]|nr:phosphoribosylanthranilate isomerase [Burkholderia sp.]